MPENEDATLRDALVEGEAKVAEVKEEKVVEVDAAKVAAEAADKVANESALELGRILVNSGVTKEQVNELLQAPAALNSIRYLVQNNPTEFLNMLERTDSNAAEKFLDKMATTYVDRYGSKGEPSKGAGKGDASAELMAEVASLRDEVKAARTREEQRNQQAALAATNQRYEGRVDDLFNQLPKDMGLTKAETKALRAQLSQDLASDPTAVQRISNGNFVDVPLKFKGIIESWAGDKKAAAESAKAARENSARGATLDVLGGPNPFMLDIPKDAANSWDATEEAFAAALTKAR